MTTILRPNFEEPLDTAKQLVEQNITLYHPPGGQILKHFLEASSIQEYNILGENMIFAEDNDHYFAIAKNDVIDKGTHAKISPLLVPQELNMGRWYRSKEILNGWNPYGGYISNKKWHLNEVIISICNIL